MMLKVFLLSALGTSAALANSYIDYPLEFADFFEQRDEQVDVVVVGLHRNVFIDAKVSYEYFQLKSDEASTEKLREFLKRQRLTKSAINAIVGELSRGVAANPDCQVALSKCTPEDMPGQAEFVFDYDAKLLRIFASTDMFETFTGDKEYYSPVTTHGALVNWSNLYAYAGKSDQSINWTNDTSLGLPVGYLSLNTEYRTSDTDENFDVNRAIYNYELEDVRAIVGYQDQNEIALNSTDFLTYGADFSGVAASVGSSANLLKGNTESRQHLYFFAPQGGQLEVYQGDRLLMTKVIGAGEQSISYDQLPTGTYTVTLRLKQGDKVVLDEPRQVVNSAAFSLPLGEWDYRVDVGMLDDSDTELSSTSEPDTYYLRGLATYRPTESLLLGVGSLADGNDSQWLLGSRYAFSEDISMEYTLGAFASGDLYQFGQLTVAPFTFSARQVEHDNIDNPNRLTQLLYGLYNKTEYSVGVFGELFNGRTFLNYFRYETESQQNVSTSDSVSLTWTHPLWGGHMSLNTNYSQSGNGHDALNIGMTWQKQFGNSVSSQLGVNFDRDGLTYSQADASYAHTGDEWRGTSQVGVKRYQDGLTVADASLSASGKNDYINYDAYGFIDTEGYRSFSTSMSGTQVLTLDGGMMTSKQGQAFMSLTPYWEADTTPETNTEVNYSALKNEKAWLEESVKVGARSIVDLPVYSNVDFELDVESENIDAQALNGEFFVVPGTYYQLNNAITPLVSQVFVLSDMNGDPIRRARCIGDGCKGVEELSDDGVFRVNYRKAQPFKLISDKRLCVYDPQLMGKRYVQAYCLPGLDSLDGQLVRQDELPTIAQTSDEQALIYIGKYESTDEVKMILSRLKEVNLISKTIEVGSVQYIYVQYQDQYSTAQRVLLESLEAYVILDTINTEQLFTSR
ncbi:TcfC E-set like domain-containing protein [Vibrio jasicida]|uniref:TcfC E-set like domain-containing protein n=1 Tax=Vibrio jasicida TaxID=766224 RepID=UPI0005EE70CE|nr:TcfC E-set like domain-containing protein [Vibrio jasicida]